MPRHKNLKSILLIGSGPVCIGQGSEFDYAGMQALKALKEESLRVILVNPNPATLMTDPSWADATYLEPITYEFLSRIIEKERPHGVLATLGGQTALNAIVALYESGLLAQFQVEILGTSIETLYQTENRALFQSQMLTIGQSIPKSCTAYSQDSALMAMQTLGFPCILRQSFSLGGSGAWVIQNEAEAQVTLSHLNRLSLQDPIILDEALIGWLEFELEVIRDCLGNAIVVCAIENIDPLGIHTGDSVSVTPIQTLTDREYQEMRMAAFSIMNVLQLVGGCNIQFAVHPTTRQRVVIEANPRVSRSSALVSKATGFPIAKVTTQLALGYTLDELTDQIGSMAFEPTLDYVVIKIPKFQDEKLFLESIPLGPKMRSVGEVMAIGSCFAESLQSALTSLDPSIIGLNDCRALLLDELKKQMKARTPKMFWLIAEAFRRGFTVERLYEMTFIAPWFLRQVQQLIQIEQYCLGDSLVELSRQDLRHLKKHGYTDSYLAQCLKTTESKVRDYRKSLHLTPRYHPIDSTAGELSVEASSFYSSYHGLCERLDLNGARPKIMVIGSGPNHIGQGLEFDYICVKALQAFSREGYETIMVHCNPSTVATDESFADTLYFTPLTVEKILDLVEKEQPRYVALQFGGQTPLKVLDALTAADVPLLGLNFSIFQQTEDRKKFRTFIQEHGLAQPPNHIVSTLAEAYDLLFFLEFPVIIRPSFVIGGQGMKVVVDARMFIDTLTDLLQGGADAVLVESYLHAAIEVDVDVISDGETIFIPAFLEHIEAVGIHSGDSACITPPLSLNQDLLMALQQQSRLIAHALHLTGIFNIQFAVQGEKIFILEVNPRASRTIPFVCKATGIDVVGMAVECLLGKPLSSMLPQCPPKLPYYVVKEAVLPFYQWPQAFCELGPEMRSTGEVMGIGKTPEEAYLKSQMATRPFHWPKPGDMLYISELQEAMVLIEALRRQGYIIVHQLHDATPPLYLFILDKNSEAFRFALKHHLPYTSTLRAAEMMVRSLSDACSLNFLEPIQVL